MKNNNKLKKFTFVNSSAESEYKALPKTVQQQFGVSLYAIQQDERPLLAITPLKDSVGIGAIELKINGSPAYRCVYVAKYMNTVAVLHSFVKTTNGVDRQAMKTAKTRYKEWVKLVEAEKIKRKKRK